MGSGTKMHEGPIFRSKGRSKKKVMENTMLTQKKCAEKANG